jgi:hypothetical protein
MLESSSHFLKLFEIKRFCDENFKKFGFILITFNNSCLHGDICNFCSNESKCLSNWVDMHYFKHYLYSGEPIPDVSIPDVAICDDCETLISDTGYNFTGVKNIEITETLKLPDGREVDYSIITKNYISPTFSKILMIIRLFTENYDINNLIALMAYKLIIY